MNEIKARIAALLSEKLSLLVPDGSDVPSPEEVAAMFEYPPDKKMGDLAFPCFKLSRTLRKAPPLIAATLGDGLAVDGIDKIEVAGGYLNFFIDRAAFAKRAVGSVLSLGERYGATEEGRGKTVVLDYSSPNVAKPFHIGHLGTTVIGHALKNIFSFNGYRCVGVNHLGDWGTQFGKMIVAFRRWGDKKTVEDGGCDALVDLYVKFHAEAEKDPSLEDEARAAFTAMENGDEDCLALWKWIIEISLAEYEKTYRQLGITFDSYTGESFYYDKAPAVVKELTEKDLLKVDDGATIVDLEKYNMPPCLILKSDGSTIYATRDIAAALYRKRTYDFDKCIYVTSAGQCLHFKQFFTVIGMMGYEWSKDLVHVPYGTMSVNGSKLATRSGNVVLLKDLFAQAVEKVQQIMREKNSPAADDPETAEAVGVGAVVFYYLSNNRMHDINFIMDEVLSFDGNTGPYAQYTYARCCSLLEKAGEEPCEDAPAPDLVGEEEFDLTRVLSLFPDRVAQAMREYEPSVITRYILEVAAAFNRFYHDCKILTAEDETTRAFRLSLVAATRRVLGNAFPLICMKTPTKI